MDRKAIKQLREDTLGLSRTPFARILKVSENTVFRWETGKVKPDPQPVEKMKRLAELVEHLRASMPSAQLVEWLEKPNAAIENFRPLDLIDSEYGLRRLRQVIDRMGQTERLPLPKRRALLSYQEKVYPLVLKDIEAAAGFALPVEVHWEELAHPGREPEEYEVSFTQGLFAPLIAALKAIRVDEIGRQALKGLTQVVIAERSSRATNGYEFEHGILKIDKNPMVFYNEIERHTAELLKVLETNL